MIKENVSDNRRIAKNTIVLYFRTFIIMLISLYTSRVVLEVLGETDFGIYNLVGSIVILFAFMNTAMQTATQRFLNFSLGRGNEREVSRIFSMSVTAHFIMAAFILMLGETIGLWFVMTRLNIPIDRYDAALWVYHFSLFGCCCSILRIPYSASIIAYERMSYYAYASIAEAVFRLLVAFLLLVMSWDNLVVYGVLMFLSIVLVNCIYMIYCHRFFPTTHYHYFWDKSLFTQLMSFSGWSMFGSMANVGVNQGLGIFLNIFFGVALNAAIGLANQVQSAVTAFVSSFQTAFSPQIVKMWAAGQGGEFINLICRSSRLSYCLVFLLAPPVLVCINTILRLWLTIVPDYTAEFVVIFVIYSMIDAASGPLWISVQATGDIKKYQILMSSIIFFNLPIMYILLLLNLSPVYVVSVRTIINFIVHFVRVGYLKKYQDFPSTYYMKDVMVPITVMTLLSLPLSLYMVRFSDSIIGTCFTFIAIMAQNVILVLCVGMKKSERKMVMDTMKSKLKR